MNVVVVGAGSLSTPHLFAAPELTETATSLHATLVGRHDEKTLAVARAIGTLNPKLELEIANVDDDLSHAFARADLVIIQARYGGYAARCHDETFPLKFGIPGDEGLGPGGLANGWRSWPELARLLERIARVQPSAAILLLTAPLGILTRCARIAYPSLRWFALCELPFVTLRAVCDEAGADWNEASYDYAGVNHLGWFDRIECCGRDLVELARRSRQNAPFPAGDVIERLHAFPLRYMQLHYASRDVLSTQRSGPPRSKTLHEYVRPGLAAYRSGDSAAISAALVLRSAPWYYDAVAPFIGFLQGRPTSTPFFLTTENRNYLDGLSPEDVVEIPHIAEADRLVPISRARALAAPLLRTLRSFVAFESVAAAAIFERNRQTLLQAVAAHPWVQGADVEGLTEQLLMPTADG